MTNFDARTSTQNAYFVAATRLLDVCPLYVARLFMCRLVLLIVCFDGNGGLMERLYRNLLQAQDSELNLFFMLSFSCDVHRFGKKLQASACTCEQEDTA